MRRGRLRAGPPGARRRTTSTSTRRSSTRRTSGGCSGRRRPLRAELAPAAGRLPRPRVDGGRQRHATSCGPHGQVPDGRGPSCGRRAALDFECELGFVCGPSTRARRADRRSTTRPSASSASCCSTTGARATSRPTSTSRSARSSASRSRPRSRRGSSPLASSTLVAPREQDPRAASTTCARRPVDARRRDRGRRSTASCCRARTPRWLYWTPAQMLAHLTVNGAALTAGDLFGTGTISGPRAGHRAAACSSASGRAVARRRRRGRHQRRAVRRGARAHRARR